MKHPFKHTCNIADQLDGLQHQRSITETSNISYRNIQGKQMQLQRNNLIHEGDLIHEGVLHQ